MPTKLLIDLGNTAIKWAYSDNPDSPQTCIYTQEQNFPQTLFNAWKDKEISAVLGCAVASEEKKSYISSILLKLGRKCEWLTAKKEFNGTFNLINGYTNPEQLGSDRWFASIGAIALHPLEALIVAHLGTATTVDSVVPCSRGYEFLGGRICPGPEMMRQALFHGTSKLTMEYGSREEFPKNTANAISTGIIESQLGLIEKAAFHMRARGYHPRIIVAGGAARVLSPEVLREYEDVDIRHNLVLHGLAEYSK